MVWRQTVLRGSHRVTDGSPPQGRMAAFVNHLYDNLARNLFTPAPYLHSFSADSAYYLFRNRTQDQDIIPTQDPRPNGVPQTQYGDQRCPLCPGRHLDSEAHMYLSCTVTSPLVHPLISEFCVRFPWDGYTQQEQMTLLLGTMPQDPVAQRHKQWFRTILSQCHALNTNHVDSAERSADVPSPDRDVGRSGASRSQCIQSDSNPSSPAGSVLDDYDL